MSEQLFRSWGTVQVLLTRHTSHIIYLDDVQDIYIILFYVVKLARVQVLVRSQVVEQVRHTVLIGCLSKQSCIKQEKS